MVPNLDELSLSIELSVPQGQGQGTMVRHWNVGQSNLGPPASFIQDGRSGISIDWNEG